MCFFFALFFFFVPLAIYFTNKLNLIIDRIASEFYLQIAIFGLLLFTLDVVVLPMVLFFSHVKCIPLHHLFGFFELSVTLFWLFPVPNLDFVCF